MPSPIGHALGGLIVHTLTAHGESEAHDRRRATAAVAVALVPDVDLLFRFVDGRNHHNAETHSVGAALLAGIGAVCIWRALGRVRAAAAGFLITLAWGSHVFLDYFNVDTHPPIGIMALWPFANGYFKFPWPILLDVGRSLDWAMVRKNTLAAAWEAALLGPLLALAWRQRRPPRSRP